MTSISKIPNDKVLVSLKKDKLLKTTRRKYLYKKELGNITKEIQSYISNFKLDTESVGNYEITTGYIEGKKINRLIIYLRSSGCQWMLEDNNGGCAMCGHLAGTTLGKKVSSNDFISQFNKIITKINFNDIPMICIYNAGSFLNENEIPKKARTYIYKTLSMMDEIKYIIFESRPEYVTDSELTLINKYLKNKRVEIGIGLESSNKYIRETCLNKGLSVKAFIGAMNRVKNYQNIYTLAYILLKPPFLSENEAILDTIKTIKWAFNVGVDLISLEPVSVQKYTLVDLLYKMNLYRSPWTWSVFEVMKNVSHLGMIRIGGFEFFPKPDMFTHNCNLCDETCIKAIEEYNTTNDIKVINDIAKLNCSCKIKWKEDLNINSQINQNIDAFLELYHKKGINYFFKRN